MVSALRSPLGTLGLYRQTLSLGSYICWFLNLVIIVFPIGILGFYFCGSHFPIASSKFRKIWIK